MKQVTPISFCFLLIISGCASNANQDGVRIVRVNENGSCRAILRGEINSAAEKNFISVASKFKEVKCKEKVLTIVSNGGAVNSGNEGIYTAMRIGRLLRSDGFETRIIDQCNTACPYLYVGGVSRLMWESNAIGFYQRRDSKGGCPDKDAKFLETEKQYLREMLSETAATKFIEYRKKSYCDAYKPKISSKELIHFGIATENTTTMKALF